MIVGDKTNSLTAGNCKYCVYYSSNTGKCLHNGYVDFRSFIKYECEKAAKDNKDGVMRIVVIYNSLNIYKDRCPESLRYIGKHIVGKTRNAYGNVVFNYQEIKKAIMG